MAYGRMTKFIRAEDSATAEDENCAYGPTLHCIVCALLFLLNQSTHAKYHLCSSLAAAEKCQNLDNPNDINVNTAMEKICAI